MAQKSDSESRLQRLVEEKHRAVLTDLNGLRRSYATLNRDQALQLSKKLVLSLQGLKTVLAASDQPEWLPNLLDSTQRFINTPQDGQVLNEHYAVLLSTHGLAASTKWHFAHDLPDALVDFDAIVEKLVADSRIDELLDKLIATLSDILTSDAIDSRRATEALQVLLKTLQESKEKSFYHQALAFRFVRTYGRHLSKEFLKKIPGVSPFVEAWDKTVEDLSDEYDDVRDALQKEVDALSEQLGTDLKERVAHQTYALPKLNDDEQED